MPYYGVQVRFRGEVLVKADSESEAEKIARERESDIDLGRLDLDSAEADLEYNPEEDAESIRQFKEDGMYLE
jgi:hypothetical protein